MGKRDTISVAMAVYNGERYLEEQLNSILSQLEKDDEIVISLDPSTDGTEAILREYCKRDKRIFVCKGTGEGIIKNFENAVRHCRNAIIFLSDQDDIWVENKVSLMLQRFRNPEVLLVIHDAKVVNENLDVLENSFFCIRKSRKGIFKNLMKNSYIGCCMAFRRRSLKSVLPFPRRIPMHDQWIGICCECMGKVDFIPEKLILYRRHSGNASEMRHASVWQMLIWRWMLLTALAERMLTRGRIRKRIV